MKQSFYSILLTSLILFYSFLSQAEINTMEDVHLLAQIHSVKDAEAITGHSIKLESEGMGKILEKLRPEDEVLLKGYVTYQPERSDTKINMNPVFHVQSIHPVSLKRLGITAQKIEEPNLTFTTAQMKGTGTIPISEEVASAMTLTASVLLVQNLTNNGGTQTMKADLERATFLSAGALATGYFIWKQIQSSRK